MHAHTYFFCIHTHTYTPWADLGKFNPTTVTISVLILYQLFFSGDLEILYILLTLQTIIVIIANSNILASQHTHTHTQTHTHARMHIYICSTGVVGAPLFQNEPHFFSYCTCNRKLNYKQSLLVRCCFCRCFSSSSNNCNLQKEYTSTY